MNYYSVNTSDTLQHHGILGQRWGKRNGPPYPLSGGAHSQREKKHGTKGWSIEAKNESTGISKSKNKDSNSSVKYSRRELEKYRKNIVMYYGDGSLAKANEYKTMPLKDLAIDKERKDNTKKVIVTAVAVAGVSAAIYLGYKYNVVNRLSGVVKAKGVNAVTPSVASNALQGASNDVDYIFKAGHEFHRQVGSPNFNLAGEAGKLTYVTTNKADTAAYMAFLKDWHGTHKRYDVALESLTQIKAPSDKKARLIFENLVKTDSSYRKEFCDAVAERAVPQFKYNRAAKVKRFSQLYQNDIIQNGPDDFFFKQAMYGFVKQGSDSKKLMNAYKKQGYDAIIDYFDKGVMSNEPLILFDASGMLRKKGETFVDRKLYKDSIDFLATVVGHPLQKKALDAKNSRLYDLYYNAVFNL